MKSRRTSDRTYVDMREAEVSALRGRVCELAIALREASELIGVGMNRAVAGDHRARIEVILQGKPKIEKKPHFAKLLSLYRLP